MIARELMGIGRGRRAEGKGVPSIVHDVLRSPGRPLDQETRDVMGARLGHDFSRVRVHADARAAASADAVGARAYAVGQDVVFGAARYEPRSVAGQRVLAHELAHVAQQGTAAPGDLRIGARGDQVEREAHQVAEGGTTVLAGQSASVLRRYESPEHEDLGDKGFVELAKFVGTREGRDWLAKSRLDPQLAHDLPRDHHRQIKVGRLILSPGEVIALMGDFYGTPEELERAPEGEIREILDAIQEERDGKLAHGKANERYEDITRKWRKGTGRKTFIELAANNAPHFTPTNREAWQVLHERAVEMARNAGKDEEAFNRALLFDAAAGHFLTDAFASGHLFELKKLISAPPGKSSGLGGWMPLEAAIVAYLQTNQPSPENPELLVYYQLARSQGALDKLVLKNIHDRLNSEGWPVRNKKGMEWRTFGDDNLRKSPDALRIGSLAVAVSRRQLSTVFRSPKAVVDSNEVLDLLPDEDSVRRATAKAISLIPEAVRDIPALLYRQVPALRAALHTKIGADSIIPALVGANVLTVASPDRQRQLLQLEEQHRKLGGPPLLAPQFTIGQW